MIRPSTRTIAFLALTTGLLLVGAGCSGGGGGGGGAGAGLRAGAVTFNNTAAGGFGVIGATYTVTGPAGTLFDMLNQVAMGAGAFVQASPINAILAAQVNAAFPGLGATAPMTTGFVLPPVDGGGGGGTTETSLQITFWWNAGANLGFLSTPFSFLATPFSNGNPGQPNGAGGSGTETYPGSSNSQGSSGAGAGGSGTGGPPAGTGRAGHNTVAVNPGPDKDLLVFGGYNDGTSPNAFDSGDRFRFDLSANTHSLGFSGTMVPGATQRVRHASAFFIDPVTGSIKAITAGGVSDCVPGALGAAIDLAAEVAGGIDSDTGTTYCFSPTEQLDAVMGTMITTRYEHSATWVPCNQVIFIGGCTGTTTPTALASIEHYDPITNTFFQPPGAALAAARCGHECALLADGRVIVVGGYDPAAPAPLGVEIYDPISSTISTAGGGGFTLMIVDHTVTRMANGWILIVGGRFPLTGGLSNEACVYKPESNSFVSLPIQEARALHSATLLADKNVLVLGGVTGGLGATQGFTTTGQVFSLDASAAGFTSTLLVGALSEARAEHTSTAVSCGSVFVIGGRNDTGSPAGLNFLDSMEFFGFSNTVPTLANGMTATSAKGATAPGTMSITVNVTDAEADGGSLIIRYREGATGAFCTATITSQTPSTVTTPANFPNMELSPAVGGTVYNFVWDFGADGLLAGTAVEIELIPVGAVVGGPLRFSAMTMDP